MIVIAVTYKRRTMRVNLQEPVESLQVVQDLIRQTFQLTEEEFSSLEINVHDSAFNEYLVLTELADVKNLARMKLQKRGEEDPEQPQDQAVSSSEDEEDKPLRYRLGGTFVPANYKLPPFEEGLVVQLETTKAQKSPLGSVWRKRIVKILYNDMMRFTKDMYPQPVEYTRVVEALLRDWPHIGDSPVVGIGWHAIVDSGYTWREALRTKFKFERRKNQDKMKHVKDKQIKYAPKEPTSSATIMKKWDTGLVWSTKEVGPVPEYAEGEDAGTEAQHRTSLNAEYQKENPNMAVVDAHMAATSVHRRHLILIKKTTVKMLQELYLPLKSGPQWLAEAARVFKNDPKKNLLTFFSDAKMKLVISTIRQTPKGQKDCDKFLTGADDSAEAKVTGILLCLAHFSGEGHKNWLWTYGVVATSKPLILIELLDPTDDDLSTAQFVPYLNGVPLHEGPTLSMLDSILILAAAVRLMNPEYPVANVKSWRLMVEAAMGYPPRDPVNAAFQRVLNNFVGC